MRRAIVVIMIAIAGLMCIRNLPFDSAPLVREKYESWTGVYRVWAVKGDVPLIDWAGRCAREIEKSRKGVYVVVREVSVEAIERAENPPDAIIYMNTDYGVSELGFVRDNCIAISEGELRGGLENTRTELAEPVAIIPRVWLYNKEAFPSTMEGVSAGCAPEDLTALITLNGGKRVAGENTRTLPGIDIGLQAAGEPTRAPEGDSFCAVGEDFIIADDALEMFERGEIDAVIGTPRDAAGDVAAFLTGERVFAKDIVLMSVLNGAEIGEDLLALMRAAAADFGAQSAAADCEDARDVVTGVVDERAAMMYVRGEMTADEAGRYVAER